MSGAGETATTTTSDRLSVWCGWVLVGAAVLTPLLAWLGPLAFAPLVSGMGLLSLPAFRVGKADRQVYGLLLLGLLWALISTRWSPFHAKVAGASTAVKLVFELPLYWAAICGARRADPRRGRLALQIMIWGMAAFGVVLLAEAVTGAQIYRALHVAFYQPIRPDLAGKNIGQATFVMALLWPLMAVGAVKARLTPWLALPMGLGLAAASHVFGFDAPFLAVFLCPVLALATWALPKAFPKILAAGTAICFLTAPLIVQGVRGEVGLERLQAAVPLSWAERIGYWSYATDRIVEKPLIGWGLDASRTFTPHIQLHPHDDCLQIWLELGLVGAVIAALFWTCLLMRFSKTGRDLTTAAMVATAGAYLLFGGLNFGVWQEWWLALGALAALVGVLVVRAAPTVAVQPST